jgi:hypothetical protein
MRQSYALTLAFLITPLSAGAQTVDPTALEVFASQASGYAHIFNGRIPEKYPNVFKGTYYLYSPQFIEGSLCYNGKYYENMWMNINAHKQELYLLSPDRRQYVLLDPELVSELWLGEEAFVYYGQNAQAGLAKGFYELLADGSCRLLKHTRTTYIERVNTQQMVLDKFFEASEQFFLVKDGRVYPIKNRNGLFKALGSHKRELTRWAAQAPSIFRDQPEEAYIQCVRYYEYLLSQE